MNKQIILSDEKKKELAKTFKFSRQTVWAALNFRTNSSVANMIRKAALERGGVLIDGTNGVVTTDFETCFMTAENLMLQQFTQRVRLVADLSSGEVKICVDNEKVESYENARINELPMIQQKAQLIANQLNK